MKLSLQKIPFKQKTLTVLLILVVPLLAFLFSFFFYTIQRQTRQLSESARNTLDYYQSAFEADVANVTLYLANLLSNDPDFQQLCYRRSYLDAHLCSYNLLQKFKLQIQSNRSLGALFVITEENGLYRGVYNSTDYTLEEKEAMLAFLQSAASSDNSYVSEGWMLRDICGRPFLFRFFGRKSVHTYCVAMLDLERAILPKPAQKAQGDTGAFAFFMESAPRENGALRPLSQEGVLEEKGIVLRDLGEQYSVLGQGQQVLLVQSPVPETGVTLGYCTPYYGFFSGMDGVQITLLLLCGVIIVLIALCYVLLQKSLFHPLTDMTTAIERIGEGDFTAKMEHPFSILEFERVRQSFNQMGERIRQLKIDSYEKELEGKQALLQYLQLQIRPHFYLSCLKNLYALAQQQQYGIIQKGILALSGYLRYLFQDSRKPIPLREEIHMIRDYFQLQSIGASNPPVCRYDIDADLDEFPIPPLSLLTFVENSVNHGSTTDRPLTVTVSVTGVGMGDQRYVSLRVTNDGPAFSQELLEEMQQLSPQMYRTHHVGIGNIRHRLQLMYGEKAQLSLYNAVGCACAEVFLPWEPEVTEKEEQHDRFGSG